MHRALSDGELRLTVSVSLEDPENTYGGHVVQTFMEDTDGFGSVFGLCVESAMKPLVGTTLAYGDLVEAVEWLSVCLLGQEHPVTAAIKDALQKEMKDA